MPVDDTFSAAHLLGDSWQSVRWFHSAEERDAVFEKMQDQPEYYRQGDSPSVLLTRIERD